MRLAEDVYYVTRDNAAAYPLNQLMQVPAGLSVVELEAIEQMCHRCDIWMQRRATATPISPTAAHPEIDNALHRPHGLYYVGPDGMIWVLSLDGCRPNLAGSDMDFALATLRTGLANLRRLRAKLSNL